MVSRLSDIANAEENCIEPWAYKGCRNHNTTLKWISMRNILPENNE